MLSRTFAMLAACATLVLTGCSGSGPKPAPDIHMIVERTLDAMSQVTAYHYEGDLAVHTDDGVHLGRQTGDWAPGHYRYLVDGLEDTPHHVLPWHGTNRVTGFLFIDDRAFFRDTGGVWREEHHLLPDGAPGDPVRFLDGRRLELLGEQVSNGVEVFRIGGEVRRGPIPDGPYPLESASEAIVNTTILISKEDYRIIQINENAEHTFVVPTMIDGERVFLETRINSLSIITFDGYDEPVFFDAPVARRYDFRRRARLLLVGRLRYIQVCPRSAVPLKGCHPLRPAVRRDPMRR